MLICSEKYPELYANIGVGWHPILDKYLPQLLKINADVTSYYIKEKFGLLRIYVYSPECSDEECKAIRTIVSEAEVESSTVCETCGKPGILHTELDYIQTLCDDCLYE